MPQFEVSENLRNIIAMEVMRVPNGILGDCPQCGSKNYRDGVCGDCGFISPEVMEMIQAWQQSQGMEPVTSSRVSFIDVFPQLTKVFNPYTPPYQDKTKLITCPTCFTKNSYSPEQGCFKCGREERPVGDLDVPSMEERGGTGATVPTSKRRFRFFGPIKTKEQQKAEKAKKTKKVQDKPKPAEPIAKRTVKGSVVRSFQNKQPEIPNLDNVTTITGQPNSQGISVGGDPSFRMQEALQTGAQIEFSQKLQNGTDSSEQTSSDANN